MISEAALPREGLPPCVTVAVFDGRRAFKRDIRQCNHDWTGTPGKPKIVVVASPLAGSFSDPDEWHPGTRSPSGLADGNVLTVWTNDPIEAEAAWERAERWVRTGELNES